MTISTKRQLLIGFSAVIVVSIAIIIAVQWGAVGSTKNRNHLYQELLERSGQLNRDLPKLLDRQTRFEQAEVSNYGMRFVYSLVGVDRYQHDVESVREQLEPAMRSAFCSSDSLRYYRENADFLEIRYLDRNEAKLFELRFTADDCK
jgi:hypothetical protein